MGPNFHRLQRGLAGVGAALQGNIIPHREQREELDDKRKKAMATDARSAFSSLQSGDINGALADLRDRQRHITRLGGSSTHTDELVAQIESGDVRGAMDGLDQFIKRAVGRGYLPGPERIKTGEIHNGQVIERDPFTNEYNARTIGGLGVFSTKNENKIREETRQTLRSQVKDIRARARNIEENYGKVKQLVKQVGRGNRIASAQAMIALIKIGDESTVRMEELIAGINRQTTTAATIEYLSAQGGTAAKVAEAIRLSFDPLNPNTMNTKDLMDVAGALVMAQIPTIHASLAEARDLGSRILTKFGNTSVFSNKFLDRISGLPNMLKPDAADKKSIVTSDAADRKRLKELRARKNAN